MSENITRRRTIGAGAIATIAAGLLGATRAEASMALPPAATAPVLGAVTDAADLAAECERQYVRVCATLHTMTAALEALPAVRTPEEDDLFRAYDDAMADHYGATIDLYLAELYRHFPGLAPALRTVAGHIQEGFNGVGECCLPDGAEA
jgi:hypothetical protein